jgi:hypothetical protein
MFLPVAPDGHLDGPGFDLVPRQTFEVGLNATVNQPPPQERILAWVAFGVSIFTTSHCQD